MSTSIRISGSSDNLFTADLTLAANRTHDLNGNSVTFLKSNFEFRAADALTSTIGFRYRNLANNQNIFSIKNQGRVEINGSDALVLLGGTSYTAYWLTTPTAQMSMFNEGLNQVGFRQNTNNLLFQRGGGGVGETHSSITIANGSWNIGLNWAALTANLNIGMTTLDQARLGVQAANGNSANKTIVVRNHLNTGNILDVRNSGKFAFNTDSISDVDYVFQGTGTSSYGVYVAGSFGNAGITSLVSATTRHSYYAAWCGFGAAYSAANSGGGATVTGTRIGFSADNFNPSDYQNIGFYGNVTNTGSSNAIQFYANAPNAGDYSFYSQAGENYFRAVDGSGVNRTLTVRNHLNTGNYFEVTNSGDIIANGATGDLNLTSIGYLSGKAGSANTFYGRSAGQTSSTGGNNTFIGYVAGLGCSTGSGNTFIGSNAGVGNNSGSNVFIGESAGSSAVGSGSVIIGAGSAASSSSGSLNCFIGFQVALYASSGAENCAFGRASLLSLGTGSQNIAMGQDSGAYRGSGFDANENPSNSVFLGAFSKAGGSNQTNQIVVGHNAVGEGSNTARIGNSSVTELHVGGNGASLALKSPDGTTWRISVDNTGTLVIV